MRHWHSFVTFYFALSSVFPVLVVTLYRDIILRSDTFGSFTTRLLPKSNYCLFHISWRGASITKKKIVVQQKHCILLNSCSKTIGPENPMRPKSLVHCNKCPKSKRVMFGLVVRMNKHTGPSSSSPNMLYLIVYSLKSHLSKTNCETEVASILL